MSTERRVRAIRFKPETDEALRRVAERHTVSANLLVNRAVEHYLPRVAPLPPPQPERHWWHWKKVQR